MMHLRADGHCVPLHHESERLKRALFREQERDPQRRAWASGVLLAGMPLRVCEFGFPGPLRDRLVVAVLKGTKTATSSLLADWQRDREPLPLVGERQAVIDSDGARVATIEIVAVEVLRLGGVDDRIARAEGESYSTAAGWRVEHERFWTEEVFPGWEDPPVLDDDTQIVVEWFWVRP
jgi:uncharacterized protein YhfF